MLSELHAKANVSLWGPACQVAEPAFITSGAGPSCDGVPLTGMAVRFGRGTKA